MPGEWLARLASGLTLTGFISTVARLELYQSLDNIVPCLTRLFEILDVFLCFEMRSA